MPFSFVRYLFLSICLGSLTACQTFSLTKTSSVEQADQFTLQGKIGIRTPQQSGSAFYTWLQQQDYFSIELTGALGIGKTTIEGRSGQVTLTNAEVGTLHAATPEALLEQATGWTAPISHLKYWVQAKPATSYAQIQYDQQQRPSQISEDQWLVDLSYSKQKKQPNRLVLTQTLTTGEQHRITMVIQNR